MASRIDLLDRVLAERSFADFVRQAWSVLEPKTLFLDNWHIDLLAEYLEAVVDGDILRSSSTYRPAQAKACWQRSFCPAGSGCATRLSGSCSPATARFSRPSIRSTGAR